MFCSMFSCVSAAQTTNSVVEHYNIPGFQGEIIVKGSKEYDKVKEQYASSSTGECIAGTMEPAVIVRPRPESQADVIAVVNYARMNNIAVAVRTGGHQYSGASSTAGTNIQLDIESTFKTRDYNADTNRLRIGISQQLGDVNEYLRDRKIFVPHGECFNVHIGGHCQSGGYGQLARAFGLFGDHILEFEIITAAGNSRTLRKKAQDREERDFFYAMAGGSPGNFAIVTHIVLEPHRDDDHPDSRAMSTCTVYTQQTLTNLMQKMVDMSNDDNMPGDIDYTVTVIRASRAELYRLPIHGDFKRLITPLVDAVTSVLPPLLFVWVQYANLKGSAEKFKDSEYNNIFNEVLDCFDSKSKALQFHQLDWKDQTPMSTLTGSWVLPIKREYDLPYVKRAYSSPQVSDNWPAWIAGRVQNVYNLPPIIDIGEDLDLSCQFQFYGGQHSAFYQKRNNGTAYAMRDCKLFSTTDVFYRQGGHNAAMKWQKTNVEESVNEHHGTFSKVDHRVFWASFGYDTDTITGYGHDLMRDWKLYYNDEAQFRKLVALKVLHDPNDVFTPNEFSLRANVN